MYLTIGIWYDRGGIHVAGGQRHKFHLNFTPKNHPAAYRALRAVLAAHGRWPQEEAAA
jgi:hypothetical protein